MISLNDVGGQQITCEGRSVAYTKANEFGYMDAFLSHVFYISHSTKGMSVRTNPGRRFLVCIIRHVALWQVGAQGCVLLLKRQKEV